MEKPSLDIPSLPFNLHTIPSWIEPELWNLDAPVRNRRFKILWFYALSWATGMSGCMFAVAVVCWLIDRFEPRAWLMFATIWALGSLLMAPAIGWAVLHDFDRAMKKLVDEKTGDDDRG